MQFSFRQSLEESIQDKLLNFNINNIIILGNFTLNNMFRFNVERILVVNSEYFPIYSIPYTNITIVLRMILFHVLQRSLGERDDEALKLTREVLSQNPEITTFWNYRREIIQDRQQTS